MGKDIRAKIVIDILICISISALSSIGIITIFKLKYLCPDDALLNYISMGVWGDKNSPYLIFINILIGYLITVLYNVFPTINCFALCMIGLETVEFGGMYFAILRYSRAKSKEIFIIIIVLLEIFVSCNFTYTILAAVVTVIGIATMLYGIMYGSFGLRVFGILFTWIGFMIRMPSFLIGACICVPLVMVICKKKIRREIFLRCFLLIVMLCAFSWLLNNLVYEKSEIWSSQKERLDYRLVDYSRLDYARHTEELQKIDISENDLECYYSWIFADFDTYSITNLKKLDQLLSFENKYNINVISLLKQMLEFRYNYYFAIIVMICLAVDYVNTRDKNYKAQIPYLANIVLITYFAIIGLFIRQRTPDNAVYMVFCSGFLACVCFLGLVENKENNTKLSYKAVFGILMLLVSVIYVKNISIENERICTTSEEKTSELIKWQNDNPEILVAGTVGPLNTFFDKPILKLYKDAHFLNRVKLGTWDMGSERWYDQIGGFGVDPDHLLIEVALKDNVVLLVNDESELNKIKTYICEHTGNDVSEKLVKHFLNSDWSLYKLSI